MYRKGLTCQSFIVQGYSKHGVLDQHTPKNTGIFFIQLSFIAHLYFTTAHKDLESSVYRLIVEPFLVSGAEVSGTF